MDGVPKAVGPLHSNTKLTLNEIAVKGCFIVQVLKLFLEKSVKTSNLRSDYSMTAFNSVTTIICGMELGTVKNSGHHLIETVQVIIVDANSCLKAGNLNSWQIVSSFD